MLHYRINPLEWMGDRTKMMYFRTIRERFEDITIDVFRGPRPRISPQTPLTKRDDGKVYPACPSFKICSYRHAHLCYNIC